MFKFILWVLLSISAILVLFIVNKHTGNNYKADKAFLLKNKVNVIELYDSLGQARLLIAPGMQARVLTSTATGKNGYSYGFINYALIKLGQLQKQINAYGGEERFWLGPEGGNFSLYFKPNVEQKFENWIVPRVIDTDGYNCVYISASKAKFTKQSTLTNCANTKLEILIERTVTLLSNAEIEQKLSFTIPKEVNKIAYQTENTITNNGNFEWTKTTGMPSIWLLSMLKSGNNASIFIPFVQGSDSALGVIVSDDYFGKVPVNRLKVKNGFVYFKADANYRSKIGISPNRATSLMGCYNAQNKTLTVLKCILPLNKAEYVNSKWGKQNNPFEGDVLNAYNDGAVSGGSQLGKFYELESSSPAANLKPNQSLTHSQQIYHFEGTETDLTYITQRLFGTSITEIKTGLN